MITDYYIIASLIYLCCMGLVYLVWRRRNIDRREYCLLFFVGLVMIWLSPALMERLGPTTLIMIYTLVPLTAAAVSTRIGKKKVEGQGADHAAIGELAMVSAGEAFPDNIKSADGELLVSTSEAAPKTRGGKFLDKIRRLKTSDDEPTPTAAEVPADEGLIAVAPTDDSLEAPALAVDAVAAEVADEVQPASAEEPLPSWFRDEGIPRRDEAWADDGLEVGLPVGDGLMSVVSLPEEAENTDEPLPSWFRDKVEEQPVAEVPADEILPADEPVLEAQAPDEIPAAITTAMDDTAAPAVEEDIAELEEAPAEAADAEFTEEVKLEAENVSLEDHIPSDELLGASGDSAIETEEVLETATPAVGETADTQIPVTVEEEVAEAEITGFDAGDEAAADILADEDTTVPNLTAAGADQVEEEIEAVVPVEEIFVEPEAGNLPVVSEQKQVKSARERMLEEKVNRLLESGFQAKFASEWTEAIRRFEEVLTITRDASLRGMLVQDIAYMYLETADYNGAEQAYQDYLRDDLTVDERNYAAREALKIRYMAQELTTRDMPLMPYRKVPRLLQIKVEETINRIDISKQMEGSKKRK